MRSSIWPRLLTRAASCKPPRGIIVFISVSRASSVDRATVLAALIRVADADAAVNQAAEAQRGYETAIHLAEKISNRILQSLALAHLADLQERQGNVRAALLAYQQALALDATLTDATGAATDWFNYGQFLRRQHAPDALVLACFAKARELTGETRGVLLSSVLQAQEEVQSGQGRGKAASRSAASAADALRIAPESLPAAH